MAVWSKVMLSKVTVEERFDGEYFSPSFLEMDSALSRAPQIEPLKRVTSSIKKGIFDISPKLYRSQGVPLIRTLQIKSPLLSKEALTFIPVEEHENHFNKTELIPGDIVFTKIGAGIGDVAVLPSDYTRYNFSQNVAGASVKRERIDGAYLLAFLTTSWGRKQLLRYMMPSGQGKLELRDIKKIKVVRLGNAETSISKLVVDAESLDRASLANYAQARHLLESELGLDKLVFQKPIGYTSLFSEVVANKRIDADYFQIPFRQIRCLLDSCNTSALSQLVSLSKGVEVGSNAYSSTGRLFIRVSNLKESALRESESDKYISDSLYQSLRDYRPQVGELLLTKDGSPGVCLAVDRAIEGIISGGIVRLNPVTDKVPKEYLALAINSVICRKQIEQECSGALILHWKPSSIRKLRIPILPDETMKKIADLVTASKGAKRESERLLAEANARIDKLIEEAIAS